MPVLFQNFQNYFLGQADGRRIAGHAVDVELRGQVNKSSRRI
jgi:hypothetical protein